MKESMRGMDFWGVTEESNVEEMKNEDPLNHLYMHVYDELWLILSKSDVLSDLYYNQAARIWKKRRNMNKYMSKNPEVKKCS